MILDTTSKSLEIILDGAITTNQLVFMASYVDVTTTAFTPGSNDGLTNSTAAVTMAAAPAASTQRQVKELSIINLDTVSATVTVRLNNSSTIRKLFTATLLTGEMLGYTAENGFLVFSATGAIKTNLAALWAQITGTPTTLGGYGITDGATFVSGTWTPTDASGASLTFTSTVGIYQKVGNVVTLSVNLTYPTTADVSAAAIGGLPFTVSSSLPNPPLIPVRSNYSGAIIAAFPVGGTKTVDIFSMLGAGSITNANLSGKIISFIGDYNF